MGLSILDSLALKSLVEEERYVVGSGDAFQVEIDIAIVGSVVSMVWRIGGDVRTKPYQ